MRSLTILAVGLLACGPSSSPAPQSHSKASVNPEPAQQDLADVPVPEPASPALEAEEPEQAAEPAEPVPDETREMFVIVDKTAVCPTRKQAMERKCGHSVEDVSMGVRKTKGSAVSVYGDAPVDGLWRAVRYQKMGRLPAWVRADDVATTPVLPFLDKWDQRPDLAEALDASSMSAKKLARVRKGKLLKWHRVTAPTFGADGQHTMVYVEQGKTGRVAIQLPPASSENEFMVHHSCMLNGDCIHLSYRCGKDYCDKISILARATGKKVLPPQDFEKEWTGSKKRMPLFKVVSFADRFGLFEPGASSFE